MINHQLFIKINFDKKFKKNKIFIRIKMLVYSLNYFFFLTKFLFIIFFYPKLLN